MNLSLASTVEIAPGVHMPRFGLGTYKSPAGPEVEDAVDAAIRLGYRSIDTASLYANEESIGAAIARSGVPRAELFVTTKVWNEEQGYEGTRRAIERSLGKLGVDYLDLYLVHWPSRAHMADTWRAMEELLAEGKTRAIGVCNHLPHHLEALLAVAEVPPAVDQVELQPRLQRPELQRYLSEHGIALESWATLMRGRVAEEPVIVDIAERLGKTPVQVALRWALQLGAIVIPKSVHAERIESNAQVFDFELTEADMAAIAALDDGTRVGPDPDTYFW